MVTDVSALIIALKDFGGLGIVIAFLIWKDIRSDRAREHAAERHRGELLLRDERRLDYDKNRLEIDKDTVGAIAALTSAIQSMNRR